MKKLFGHKKEDTEPRQYYEDWEYEEVEDSAWDDEAEPEEKLREAGRGADDYEDSGDYGDIEEEYTEEEAAYTPYTQEGEDAVYYDAPEEEYADEDYRVEEYEENTVGTDDGYENTEYADDGYEDAGTAYAEDGYPDDSGADAAYADGEYTDDGYESAAYAEDADTTYADNEYTDEYADEYADDEDYEEEQARPGFFKKLALGFAGMGTMDKVITCTGAAVLIMALITGGIYAGNRILKNQVSSFVTVGASLKDIELPGQAGLLAVADAQTAKREAAALIEEQQRQQEEEERRRQEEEQRRAEEEKAQEQESIVNVTMTLTSVEKDIKIKFTNKSTGKLITGVPFEVTVKGSDKKSQVWSDDDMDGIIYKKDVPAGKYTISMNALSQDKYKNYELPASAKSVEVKKQIVYAQVDVSNEIKKESEVNVAKEDTKKNETKVEEKLTDTVAWVESTVTLESFAEVEKNTVKDPAKAAAAGTTGMETAGSLAFGFIGADTEQIDGSYTAGGRLAAGYTGTGLVNAAPVAFDVQTIAEQTPAGYMASISESRRELLPGESFILKVICEGITLTQVTWSSSAPEVASVDENGKVTAHAKGTAIISYTAQGKAESKEPVSGGDTVSGGDSGTVITGLTGSCSVTVKDAVKKQITLDKTEAQLAIGKTIVIQAKVEGGQEQIPVTAVSSDPGIVTAAVSGRQITLTGIANGSAEVTVSYTEKEETISAKCKVTVKTDPKEDKVTKLKDNENRQIYVEENGQYREAVYADYYTAQKFYIKAGVKYTGWQTIEGKVYYFDASGKKVTGEQVIQGAKYHFASDGSLITGNGTIGIDVSKWNGTIDWKAVKNSGISYVIIRSGYRGSSQGSLIEDPKFRTNIQGAIDAGLKVGVYFFTQAVSATEAVEEASMVLEQIAGYRISYPVFLDVEASGGRGDRIDKATRTEVCKAFCATIQNAGYTAGIYANKNWLTEKIDAPQLSAYKIWLAQYASAPTYTGRYDLWQYQSTGKVSGISGNVDMNWSYLGY